jgi:transposase
VDRKKELTRYIEEMLGERIDWLAASSPAGLPHHLKMSFQIARGRLLGTESLFLFSERADETPVPALEQQLAAFKERTHLPPVLVFEQLPARTAERLAKRRVSFVIIGRQLFLPFLLVHLRKDRTKKFPGLDVGPLSPSAETILIGQLLDGRFESKSGEEVAKVLKDSAMTASKAIRELEERGFCRLRRVGRKKLLSFEERSVLWEAARKVLGNPVQVIRYAGQKPDVPWSLAGMSALSKQSMLADDRQRTIAVYRRDLQQAKNVERNLSADPEASSYKVEVWNRKPWLFSQEKAVDPISLYLSLRTEPDERIQSELESVMKRIGLPIHGGTNG